MGRLAIQILAVLWATSGIVSAQVDNQSDVYQTQIRESQEVALSGLEIFRQLIDEQNYHRLGLKSLEESSSLSLGRPLPVFTVPYDGLLSFRSGDNPTALLQANEKLSYPITAGGQARSMLLLSRANYRWKLLGFSSAKVAKKFVRLVQASVGVTRLPLAAYSDVQIPTLSLYFVGYSLDNKLFLIPLYDQPALNLREGQAQPADKVFAILTTYVRNAELRYGPGSNKSYATQDTTHSLSSPVIVHRGDTH